MCLSKVTKTVYVPRSKAITAYKVFSQFLTGGSHYPLGSPKKGVFTSSKLSVVYDKLSPGFHAFKYKTSARRYKGSPGETIKTVKLWGLITFGVQNSVRFYGGGVKLSSAYAAQYMRILK